jgi:hypothetical protein
MRIAKSGARTRTTVAGRVVGKTEVVILKWQGLTGLAPSAVKAYSSEVTVWKIYGVDRQLWRPEERLGSLIAP